MDRLPISFNIRNRRVVLVGGGEIAPVVTRPDAAQEVMALPLREAREVFERQYLEAQILRFGGNISRTAGFVGMERSALHRKLRTLGISPGERH